MLIATKSILASAVEAQDGSVGTIKDLYFSGESWMVRYLVIDTGRWLPGRKVLLSPATVSVKDWSALTIAVSLTKAQVEESPPVFAENPVSRQHEVELANYFAWPHYWAGGTGALDPPAITKAAEEIKNSTGDRPHLSADRVKSSETNLRSAREVVGYYINAKDGDLGHVDELIVDDDAWAIRYFIVNTHNWLPGRKVTIAPTWVDTIDWSAKKVRVNMTREQIKGSPEFDESAPVNRQYEEHLYDYYGRERYWA